MSVLTAEALLDIIMPIWCDPSDMLTIYVHPDMYRRMDAAQRRYHALKVLGIAPDSAQARKVRRVLR